MKNPSIKSLFNFNNKKILITGASGQIVGAVGVIGPARINYARIIPIVDYTAQVVGRLLGKK